LQQRWYGSQSLKYQIFCFLRKYLLTARIDHSISNTETIPAFMLVPMVLRSFVSSFLSSGQGCIQFTLVSLIFSTFLEHWLVDWVHRFYSLHKPSRPVASLLIWELRAKQVEWLPQFHTEPQTQVSWLSLPSRLFLLQFSCPN
jgi:hypothetical protein